MPDWDWGYPEDEIDFSPLPIPDDPVYEAPAEMSDWSPEDWTSWAQNIAQGAGSAAGALGGGSSGSGGFNVSDLLKALGLTSGSGEYSWLLPLLSMFAGAAGTWNLNSSTKDASETLQNAAKEASAKSEELIGGARGNFEPYIAAGQGALPQLQALVGKPLAAQFKAQGAPSNAAGKFFGAMSLNDLAKLRKGA